MARIIPFKGLRYNQKKVGSLASVVTPPYDIIDEVSQARYYAENPVNIIRLELGLEFPQDNANNNRYTRSAHYLEKWIEDETLVYEERPAIYVYQQEFYHLGFTRIRTGFICGLKVEPYEKGNILPHEDTLSKAKTDRLHLLRSTKCNFSPIFGLYSDENRQIESIMADYIKDRKPEIKITDEDNEIHRVWVIDQADTIKKIMEFMSTKQVFIADGHHRYETSLEYAKEMKEQRYENHDYVMATLVNLYNDGLVILPTHRVVGSLAKFHSSDFIKQLAADFYLEAWADKQDREGFLLELGKRGQDNHVIGMYLDGKLYFLTLKNFSQASSLLPQDKSHFWKKLDVTLLDIFILDRLLGIGETERRKQENLSYSRSINWVMEQVDNQQYQIGFLLNPTPVDDIVNVAKAGDKMPQKSTYFYPKLLTGLVINHL
ncbi:MAG: DUF1015 domain-containing protein [Syntrophomonadaceae bacterium]|jgi:uncharacterized protein (DUF1015 family)